MKRRIFIITIIALAFFSCEEISPVVTGKMGNQGPVPPENQQRQVLVEEFTGVQCVNCPNGSIIIEGLLAQHGQQLVAISIHAGQFSPPYSQSAYDFRTPDGNNLLNYLGAPFGYPSAVVNRKLFDNQFGLQVGQNEWAGYIAQELTLPPQVLIDINPTFNNATREGEIDVILFVKETISDPDVRLSIIFTESNIVDHQLTPTSSPNTDPDYKHKHVFRGMATPFDGSPITEPLVEGSQISKSFSYSLPDDWNESEVSVVVIVSHSGQRKDVIQAHQEHLIE